jgi:hypothetical protein
VLGVTGERIMRRPSLVFQVGQDVATSYRLNIRSERRNGFVDSFFMVAEKPVAGTVRFLSGKLVQPPVYLFPPASK